MRRSHDPLGELRTQLNAYVVSASYPDDRYVVECLREAIRASARGNFGVGAVLIDDAGRVVQKGQNRVFVPRFRSDLHAEMDAMTKFERRNDRTLRGYTLYTSVEPCPMCFARLITAGVSTVRYACPDKQGGMVHLMGRLPPVWRDLVAGQVFARASCSPDLTALAESVFQLNVVALDGKLRKRR